MPIQAASHELMPALIHMRIHAAGREELEKEGLRRRGRRHKTGAAINRVNGPAIPMMRRMIISVAPDPPSGGLRCGDVSRQERGKKGKDSRFLHDFFPFRDHGRVQGPW